NNGYMRASVQGSIWPPARLIPRYQLPVVCSHPQQEHFAADEVGTVYATVLRALRAHPAYRCPRPGIASRASGRRDQCGHQVSRGDEMGITSTPVIRLLQEDT